MTVYDGRIQLFALTAAQWAAANPVLMLGEIGAQDVGSSTPVLKIGDGVRPYSTLPNLLAPVTVANDYVAGPVTTLPPGSGATVIIDNTVDPPSISFGIPSGATGPANALAIGTVTASAPGAPADATITGTPPNQVLSLVIPRGDPGPQGIQGPQGIPGTMAPGNPTAQVGLAAVNGVSALAMRADGAPALSQAIVPTWTGAHLFRGGVTRGGTAAQVSVGILGGVIPLLELTASSPGVDKKSTELLHTNAGSFQIQFINEAGNLARSIFQAHPGTTGPAVGSLEFGNASDNPAYSFLGTGLTRFNGDVRVLGHSRFGGWMGTPGADPLGPATEAGFVNGNALVIGYNRSAGGYIPLQLAGSTVEVVTGGLSRLMITATGQANFSGALANAAGSSQMNFTPHAYGSIGVTGVTGGYHGVQVDDGGLRPAFISNNSSAGIYVPGDSRWMLQRINSSTYVIGYDVTGQNFSAASFNVSSSRTLKRETGAPSAARVREVLSGLRVVLYRLLADPKQEHIGGIAEEVHAVCPWLSHDGKTIAMDRLAWLLLADWQASRGITAS